MTIAARGRQNGHAPLALPPAPPVIPAKLKFQRVLFSKPVSFGEAGWTGDVGRLGAIYDLGRVMSLPDQWDTLVAEEKDQHEALAAEVDRLRATFETEWADYHAHARNAGRDDGSRVTAIAALMTTPDLSAAEILQRARALLDAPAADPWAPTVDEMAAYGAAAAAVEAATAPLQARLAAIQASIAHKVIAWCVVSLGELVTEPPTRLRPTVHQEIRWPWAEDPPDPQVPASYDARLGGILEPAVVEWLAQVGLDQARAELQSPPYARR